MTQRGKATDPRDNNAMHDNPALCRFFSDQLFDGIKQLTDVLRIDADFFISQIDVELFFHLEHDLHQVDRRYAKLVQGCIGHDFARINFALACNNLNDLLAYVRHSFASFDAPIQI